MKYGISGPSNLCTSLMLLDFQHKSLYKFDFKTNVVFFADHQFCYIQKEMLLYENKTKS